MGANTMQRMAAAEAMLRQQQRDLAKVRKARANGVVSVTPNDGQNRRQRRRALALERKEARLEALANHSKESDESNEIPAVLKEAVNREVK